MVMQNITTDFIYDFPTPLQQLCHRTFNCEGISNQHHAIVASASTSHPTRLHKRKPGKPLGERQKTGFPLSRKTLAGLGYSVDPTQRKI
jgi:hypothetical protein